MCFFFFKQKTAYELRISDWSSDVCSSDLFRQIKTVGRQAAAIASECGEDQRGRTPASEKPQPIMKARIDRVASPIPTRKAELPNRKCFSSSIWLRSVASFKRDRWCRQTS